MNCDRLVDIEEWASLYALGMLSREEARAFEDELALGGQAPASLRIFDRLVADLALAAPEAAPSPALRDRLLAHIAQAA
jgi:anti-sigma-K factor RskA